MGSASFRATRREVIHLTKATHFYSFWKHFCCKNNKVKEQEGAVLRHFSNNGPFLLIGAHRTPIFQHCVSQNILKCTALHLVSIYIFYLLKLFTLVPIVTMWMLQVQIPFPIPKRPWHCSSLLSSFSRTRLGGCNITQITFLAWEVFYIMMTEAISPLAPGVRPGCIPRGHDTIHTSSE